jgi:trans-2,3-dihydro-3-hydroxyanthranilate isomerase
MGFDFSLVDVFTDRPFGGNRLAVFPDATGIADATMQQLAWEFNFSETTFVLPPSDPSCTCRVRIFTPRQELPFAGHPTVGTAAVLASLSDDKQFVFEEGIGPVRVDLDGESMRLYLDSPRYESSSEAPPTAEIARALSLPDDAISDSWYGGIGLKFCFVRLASPELVDRAVLDKDAWASGVVGTWSAELYVFAGDFRDRARVHARFFAPALGVDEDPATGSACASLAASLAQRSPEPNGTYRLRIDQGVVMGRPSALEGTARKEDGRIAEVVVSGFATIVGHGTMTLPSGYGDVHWKESGSEGCAV